MKSQRPPLSFITAIYCHSSSNENAFYESLKTTRHRPHEQQNIYEEKNNSNYELTNNSTATVNKS